MSAVHLGIENCSSVYDWRGILGTREKDEGMGEEMLAYRK